jgi:hypothetical protein
MSDAIDYSEMRHILRIPSVSIRPLVRPLVRLARCMPLNKTGIDLKVDVTETSIAFRHRSCAQYARGAPRTRRTEWIKTTMQEGSTRNRSRFRKAVETDWLSDASQKTVIA